LWAVLFFILGPAAIAHAQPAPEGVPDNVLDLRIEGSYTYDDNINRAPKGQERLSEHLLGLSATKTRNFVVNPFTRFLVDGVVGGEVAHAFSKLGRLFAEIQPALQYRKSASLYAPTLTVFGRASAERFGSDQRSGYRYSAGISALQPVTDRVNLFGVLARNGRNANSRVFDADDTSLQLSLDYALATRGTVYLSGEYRRGDVVSTGPESLINLDLAEVFVRDDAYGSRQFISYRIDAKTTIATIGYNVPLGTGGSLDVSWRWARSTPVQNAGFAGAETLRYLDNQLTLVYAKRF